MTYLVVIDDIDTRKLCKGLDEDGKDNSLSETGFGEHFLKSNFHTVFESNLITHLRKLSLEKGFVIANISVKAFEHLISFIIAFFLHEPTWGVREPESSNQDNETWKTFCRANKYSEVRDRRLKTYGLQKQISIGNHHRHKSNQSRSTAGKFSMKKSNMYHLTYVG